MFGDSFSLPTVATRTRLLVERFALFEVLSSADLRVAVQVGDKEDQANNQRTESLSSSGHRGSLLGIAGASHRER